jgi:glycine C-acetyltransferase
MTSITTKELNEYILGGSVATYLNVSGKNILDRFQSHTDWHDARYEFGLDPYSKGSNGAILTECQAQDRNGKIIHGINMASQDYLSLGSHPSIKEAAKMAVDRYGFHSAGSPALMGNTTPSIALEKKLAEFVGMQECVIFPTGWAAAYGVIRGLIKPDDCVIIDALAHASLVEGARAATKNVYVFPHLSLAGLERRLKRVRAEKPEAGILVVTESLFSMDSDTPDLVAHQELARKYDALLLVDAAHDLGCLGATGRGHLETQGLLGKVDLLMGSFSKTFASNGGFVASNHPALKLALRYGSCPLTFSSAISPVQASVVLESIRIIESNEGKLRRSQMLQNANYLRQTLKNSGFEVMGDPSAIVPAILGDSGRSRFITKHCLEGGALVNLVEYPAVAKNAARVRLQVMSDHTYQQIDRFVDILKLATVDADNDLLKLSKSLLN